MTRPAAASAPCPGSAATATATAVLVATGAGSWWWVLKGSAVAIALVAAVAAVAVLLAAEWLSGRSAGGLLALWLAAAVWAAGAPAGQLLPHAWPSLVARLIGGAQRLTAPGGGPIADHSWPLGAWLLGAGTCWVAGSALAGSEPSSARRRAVTFGILAAPWIAAVAARQTDRAAWQGATVLLAGLLWFGAEGLALRRAVALGLAAALACVGITLAIGPRTRWLSPAVLSGAAPPSWTLQTEPSYGPLHDPRSGATLLEVTAAEPALWRMQVLTRFAGPGWRIGYPPAEPPQPGAGVVEARVDVRGLRNDLVVAPGRIVAVHANGKVRHLPGEAWQVAPLPQRGDTYSVRASLVRATTEQLQRAPAPTDPRLHPYTRLEPGDDGHSVGTPLFGQPPNPRVTAVLERTPYGPVAALARQLAAGARTQWDVVARVHRYLLDGDRFHYTTNLPQAGPLPLVDFLLRGRAGHCQHFAGAAALLLRLAGVPTRVAVGFATGVRHDGGRFTVRDVDAHAWIEVYFQGHGWVAFNPTPTAAQAEIPRQLDPLAPAPAVTDSHHPSDGLGGLAVSALLAALVAAGMRTVRRRIRGGRVSLEQLLAALVRRTGGHIGTSSTLAELGLELARVVGPNTAALAAHAERARFAPHPATPAAHPRSQIVRALAMDLGPVRALGVLIAAAAAARPPTGSPASAGQSGTTIWSRPGSAAG